MDFHIITGGKGGVGKTLTALSLFLYYIEKKKLTFFDFNQNNPDLWKLLTHILDADNDRHVNKKGDILATKLAKNEISSDFIGYALHLTDKYKLINGIEGFYEKISDAIISVEEKFAYEPEVCIIDTGFHIANLISNNFERKELLKHNFYIWFVWTISNITREDLSSISRAIEWFSKNFNDFKHEFNVLHVFNPYHYLPPVFEIRKKIFRKEEAYEMDLQIDNFIELYENTFKNPEPKITLDFETLKNIFEAFLKKIINIDKYKIIDLFAKELKGIYNKKPANLLIIPSLSSEVLGIIEIGINQIPNIDQLSNKMQEYSKYLITQWEYFKG